MAENPGLLTGICLQWLTERPFIDISRQSPYFCLLGEKWCLKLEIMDHAGINYEITVRLIPGPKHRYSGTTFWVTTTVLVERPEMALIGFEASATVRSTLTTIFNRLVSKKTVQTSDSANYWRINCLLSCEKPLSLQINNDTVVLSTAANTTLPSTNADKCIQASLEIPPDMVGLSEDFSNLLEKEIYPDVKLRCGGQFISVHRSVLAARSEVFNAMFRNKMSESETNCIDVPDLEVPVLSSLLKYVYSGKIPDLSEDSASSLYEAGDKYAMHSLKRACYDWLIRHLTEENCISYLNIADAHTDLDFKATVISFIINHPKVLKSTLWLRVAKEHSDLAVEVLQSFADSTIE